jgi:hypothetical protein
MDSFRFSYVLVLGRLGLVCIVVLGLARLDCDGWLRALRRDLRVSGHFKPRGKHRLPALVFRYPARALKPLRRRLPRATRL